MPSNRDRDRAKLLYLKQQQRQAAKANRVRRNQQIIGGVLAVLLVSGFVFALQQTLKEPEAKPTAAPTTPTSTLKPAPPKSLAENSIWTAKVTTSVGEFEFQLDGKKAPQTVASFINLTRTKYYLKSKCHRLTTGGIYVLQCGDPTGTGGGDPGYSYGVENVPAGGKFPRGTLAMARTNDPNSNGGQFFIVHKDTVLPADPGYTIFGTVTKGMDVVDKVVAAGLAPSTPAPAPGETPTDGAPKTDVVFNSITVTKK